MSDRACVRGCTQQGVHYATCVDFGRTDGDCRGCAPVDARNGVLLCDRCYGRLRRALELAPDVIAHLRSIADPLKATVYDRVLVNGSAPEGIPAPVAADLIDACSDIMHVIGGGKLAPGASSDAAYQQALDAVEFILLGFDQIANDADAVLEWWRLVMSSSLEAEGQGDFWTITRALLRWPLEERRRWAKQPCPECGMRAVKITPPRHRHARTWFACSSCGWRRNEKDDDGLWAAAFGLYAEAGQDEGSTMGKGTLETRDLDMGEAIKAGVQYVLDNSAAVERAGTFGVPSAAVIGALPAVAEQFAQLADSLGDHVRKNYANGDLIAGGARLVATAIRDAVAGGNGAAALDALAAELAEDAEAVA